MNIQTFFDEVVAAVSTLEGVRAIGKSGGQALRADEQSDIDLFIYCKRVPSTQSREERYEKLGCLSGFKASASAGRFWGVCDFVFCGEVEICLMYFLQDETQQEIESILAGERLEKEGNYFFPTGRLHSIGSLFAVYDPSSYIDGLKNRIRRYPPELKRGLIAHHLWRICDDEDFSRAVYRRDLLFFHAVLDTAIDHFLQVVFALNECYFASRKRSAWFLQGFSLVPINCAGRMCEIIELGAKVDTLEDAYALWSALCKELETIAKGAAKP